MKVGGRKLYEAARKGEVLEAAPRPIRVDAVRAGARSGRRTWTSGSRAPAGTYVRVLLADVGAALGCGAHLTRLRRTAIGALRRATRRSRPTIRARRCRSSARWRTCRAWTSSPRRRSRPATAGSSARPGSTGPYAVFAPDGHADRGLRGRGREGPSAGDPRRAGLTCGRAPPWARLRADGRRRSRRSKSNVVAATSRSPSRS